MVSSLIGNHLLPIGEGLSSLLSRILG
eukprot:UN01994